MYARAHTHVHTPTPTRARAHTHTNTHTDDTRTGCIGDTVLCFGDDDNSTAVGPFWTHHAFVYRGAYVGLLAPLLLSQGPSVWGLKLLVYGALRS